MTTLLGRAQRRAVEAVEVLAAVRQPQARAAIRRLLDRHGIAERDYDAALQSLRTSARVALHFHPERLDRFRRCVAQGFLDDGRYRNQFETGLSGGSPTAFAGGERDRWEQRLFGGAYHADDVADGDRPKYGSLDLLRHPDGPSPRFGSCFLLLKPEVSQRTTFTYGGSQEPDAEDRTGTVAILEPVIGPLLGVLERNRRMLGPIELGIADFLERLTRLGERRVVPSQDQPLGRVLDHFVEAQVHGVISLRDDVEEMVGDAAFCHHEVGDVLRAVAERYRIQLHWHRGFRLPTSQVPAVFRGYSLAALAQRAAIDGVIDAASLGACANSLELEPERWNGWGAHEELLTAFRRVWHVLVLGGDGAGPPPPLT